MPAPVARPAGHLALLLPPEMHSSRASSSTLVQPLPIELQSGMHVHTQGRLRAAERAGLVVLDRLVGRLDDAFGRNPKAIAERIFDGFHALIQHTEVSACELRPVARPAAGKRSNRCEISKTLGQGKCCQCPEAHIIAADGHEHHVDRTLARLRRAPALADSLLRYVRAAMCVDRQRIARVMRAGAAAQKIAQLIKLRANLAAGDFARAFARIHINKETLGNVGTGAGEACKAY